MLHCHSSPVNLKLQFKEAAAYAGRKCQKLLKWTEFLKRGRRQKDMLKLPKWNRQNALKILQTMNALKNLQSNLSMKIISVYTCTWTYVHVTMNNFWIIKNFLDFISTPYHRTQRIKNLFTVCIEKNLLVT